MKVLLAAKYVPTGPRPIGGVQSWIGTVAAELERLGHAVTLWQPGFGVMRGGFDLGILANSTHTGALARACESVLAVSHGIIEDERPPAGWPVVFTSEGVRAHWAGDGAVIRQPIDLQFWAPAALAIREVPMLVRYSYRGGLPWLPEVAQEMGMHFVHLRDVTHDQARDVLRGAACVLATGRAALEVMACGVPVVICDHRSAYQGPLLDPDTMGARKRNYSGRGGLEPTPSSVTSFVRIASDVGSLRGFVEKFHDVRRIVPQLLEAACCTC